MDKLRAYLKSLPSAEQEAFAARCGTTLGYLRKALSVGQRISEGLAMRIEIESARTVRAEEICPEAPWSCFRGAELATQPPQATEAA